MGSCSNCSNVLDPSVRFCPNCGSAAVAPPPVPDGKPQSWKEMKARLGRNPSLKEWQETRDINRKPRSAFRTILSFLGVCVGLFVLLIIGVAAFSSSSEKSAGTPDASAATQNSNPATSNPNAEETPKNEVYKVNDSVSVGYWSYRVNDAKWADTVGPEMMRQNADAKFLILSMSVRNNDKTASALPPVKLVDAQGREFEESSAAMMLENAFGPLKQVNPTVQSNGLVLFDVPPGHYWVVVSGGFASPQTARIELN